ncbi:unnamed protein product [Urochloa humidicola]
MSSSSSSAPIASTFAPITKKLGKANYLLWSAHITAAVRVARLEGFLDGSAVAPSKDIEVHLCDGKKEKRPNQAYAQWVAQEQQFLSHLLSSLSHEILMQVVALQSSSQVWSAIEASFTSVTKARSVNTHLVLTTTKKGSMSVADYYTKMKALSDEMAAAGKPMDDDEFVAYVLNGLEEDFNPLVSALLTRVEPIKTDECWRAKVTIFYPYLPLIIARI